MTTHQSTIRNNNRTELTGQLPFCLEVKLILKNSCTSPQLTNKLARGNLRTTSFYRYATYHRALNASCRRGWRLIPSHKTESREGAPGDRKFDEFKFLSPWMDTNQSVLDASEVLRKLHEMEGADLCNKHGLRLHILAKSLSCRDLVKLCQNFTKYEDAIDTLVPSSRRSGSTASNQFFRSNKLALNKGTNKERNELLAGCQNVDSLVSFMNPDNKKSYKLNLSNMLKETASSDDVNNCSFEFRQHSVTTNPVKIRSWVSLFLAIVNNSAQMHPPNALKECRTIDEEFDALFKYVVKCEDLKTYFKKRRSHLATAVRRKRGVDKICGGSRGTGKKKGSLVECGCCFGSFPKSQVWSCTKNAHLFCKSCVRRYAEEEIFTRHNSEIKCIAMEGCSGKFKDDHLKVILPKKTMNKLTDVKYSRKMQRKGYRFCECPKCGTKGHVKMNSAIFRCTSCNYQSCPLCKEPAHPNQRCSEVEKEIERKARNDVEESMSSARIRKCPVCTVASIIDSGCNKMTCPQCRSQWCYVCREVASSMDHWNNGRCKLYNDGVMDITDRGVVEAAGSQTANKYSGAQEALAVRGLVQKLL